MRKCIGLVPVRELISWIRSVTSMNPIVAVKSRSGDGPSQLLILTGRFDRNRPIKHLYPLLILHNISFFSPLLKDYTNVIIMRLNPTYEMRKSVGGPYVTYSTYVAFFFYNTREHLCRVLARMSPARPNE